MNSTRIVDVVNYMPERIVRNSELPLPEGDASLGDHSFFSGVHERRFASPDYTSAELGTAALQKLLDRSSVRAEQLDLIICAVQLNDTFSPGAGAAIQFAVGAKSAAVHQLDNGCCSWISAISTARAFIDSGRYQNVAVVTVTNFISRLEDFQRKPESFVLGDGASATLLTAAAEPTVLATHEQAFGENWGALRVEPDNALGSDDPAAGLDLPFWAGSAGPFTVQFDEKMLARLYRVSMEQLPQAVDTVITQAGLRNADVRWLFTHQPNENYVAEWRKRCGFDETRAYDTLNHYGNMFQSSLPVTFADAIDNGVLKSGDLVAFATFSHGGELVGSMVWRWT